MFCVSICITVMQIIQYKRRRGVVMASTLNIRIDSALKERGDKVLKENGISVTEAIRTLWETLAKTHELPEFLQNQDSKKKVVRKKLNAIELLGALPATRFSNMSDDELRDMQYEEKLREYEALA